MKTSLHCSYLSYLTRDEWKLGVVSFGSCCPQLTAQKGFPAAPLLLWTPCPEVGRGRWRVGSCAFFQEEAVLPCLSSR